MPRMLKEAILDYLASDNLRVIDITYKRRHFEMNGFCAFILQF
jgi:hypothetical protein